MSPSQATRRTGRPITSRWLGPILGAQEVHRVFGFGRVQGLIGNLLRRGAFASFLLAVDGAGFLCGLGGEALQVGSFGLRVKTWYLPLRGALDSKLRSQQPPKFQTTLRARAFPKPPPP